MVDESLPIDVQHLMGAIEKHGCHEQQFFVIVFFLELSLYSTPHDTNWIVER